MNLCKQIDAYLKSMSACEETLNGTQVWTTCVYPSFEPVYVYIVKKGDGFIVHDAGETMAVVLAHGQDADVAERGMLSECKRQGVVFERRSISLSIENPDWLKTAIVCVANACAAAANNALSLSAEKTKHKLLDAICETLSNKIPKTSIIMDYSFLGVSGRNYKFDLAVETTNQLTLIETVNSHPASVNAKYVAFADVGESSKVRKIAAHDGRLSSEEVLLLQNVAIVASPAAVSGLVMKNERLH